MAVVHEHGLDVGAADVHAEESLPLEARGPALENGNSVARPRKLSLWRGKIADIA
jgi:hypothetical protein